VIVGIISWLLCFSFLLVITILVHHAFRMTGILLRATTFVFLWMFNTTLFMFLLGFLGLLAPIPILIVSFIGLIVLLAKEASRTTFLEAIRHCGNLYPNCRAWFMQFPRWLKWFSVAFICLSALRFLFLIWVLPPFVWDSLTYHLTNVAEWTQKGRIFLVNAPVVRVALPSNYEVLTTWFTVFLHHDVFIEAAGIPAYVLAFLAALTLARRYQLSRPAAWMAALAYISTPALILATTGTKNDPQMAALFLLIVLLLTDLIRREDVTPQRNFAGQVVLLIVVLLYALGTKIYLFHMLPGFFFIGIFEAVRIRQKGFWRRLLQLISASWKEKSQGARLGLAAILSAGVLIGLFWYVRNTLLFHNPFYPFGLKYGDEVILEAAHKSFPLGFERLPENIISFTQKFGDKLYKIIPALRDTTGWGWFVYVLGIPATLWAFVRRKNLRILMLGFLITLLALFYSTRPSPFNMRYVIWFPAIFAIGFAALYDRLPKAYRLERFAFAGLFVFCLALNLLLTVNYNRITIEQFTRMLSTPVEDRDAAKLSVYVPEEYEEALDTVSNSELLGYNVFLDGLIYPLYRADYSQRIVYVPISEDDNCEGVADRMQAAGTKWLFTSETMTDVSVRSILQGCEEAGVLTSPRRGLYVLLEN
jgi:hypothetical protein